MGKSNFIIPECYVDTNLIKTLLACEVNHQKGCNQVCKVMKEKFRDEFAVGIMDDDKMKPQYTREFEEVASSEHLTVMKHPQRAHFLIFIRPAVEELILSGAADIGFDLRTTGLPEDMDGLKKETKDVKANNDPRFKQLFREMEKAREFSLLKKIVRYLQENEYKSDVEVIRAFF